MSISVDREASLESKLGKRNAGQELSGSKRRGSVAAGCPKLTPLLGEPHFKRL